MNKNVSRMKNLLKKLLGLKVYSPKRQEALLRLCLNEIGLDDSFSINHDKGINIVNQKKYGILYPLSFYLKAYQIYCEENKNIFASFQGYINYEGGRAKMLEPFMARKDCLIIDDSYGRKKSNKFKFNDDYFRTMSKSKFVLCPHHVNWNGDKSTLWTYRFLEAIMARSIPIVFRETPLNKEFTGDYIFFYSDEIPSNIVDEEYDKIVDKNYSILIKDNSTLAIINRAN